MILILSGAIVESGIMHEKILYKPKRTIYIHRYHFYTFLWVPKHFINAGTYPERY